MMIKMADCSLVLNDVLCFLVNKFSKTPVKTLKASVVDFYNVDVLADAKLCLLNDINGMNLTNKPPHFPLRRFCDGRLAHEVDDLLTLFTFCDEMKLLDKLPKYVSSSPDNMPSLRLYEGDLQVLMSLLRSMGDKVESFGSALAAITRDVRELQVWPSLPQPARAPASVVNTRPTAAD